MKIFPFQAWYPNFDFIASADYFFGSVKEEYLTYQEAGFFHKSEQPALFFYQIKSNFRTYTGLVCCTDINEFERGNILKHEKTLAAKEQIIIKLLVQRKALVKPVLLVYKRVKEINELILRHINKHQPLYSTYFQQDEQEHFVWKITDKAILERVQKLFDKKVQTTYIADGHHRTTTLALLNERLKNQAHKGDYRQLMVVLFGSDQLDLLEYNRVVEGLNEITPTIYMAKLAAVFDITPLENPQKPNRKHQLTMLINREWYQLEWKKKVLKAYKGQKHILDAHLLNEKVLKGILGIRDVRFDQRIEYIAGTEGLRGLEKATIASPNKIGFYLFPVKVEELMSLADKYQLLPPKSTYFEPRIKSGLLVKSLEINSTDNQKAG